MYYKEAFRTGHRLGTKLCEHKPGKPIYGLYANVDVFDQLEKLLEVHNEIPSLPIAALTIDFIGLARLRKICIENSIASFSIPKCLLDKGVPEKYCPSEAITTGILANRSATDNSQSGRGLDLFLAAVQQATMTFNSSAGISADVILALAENHIGTIQHDFQKWKVKNDTQQEITLPDWVTKKIVTRPEAEWVGSTLIDKNVFSAEMNVTRQQYNSLIHAQSQEEQRTLRTRWKDRRFTNKHYERATANTISTHIPWLPRELTRQTKDRIISQLALLGALSFGAALIAYFLITSYATSFPSSVSVCLASLPTVTSVCVAGILVCAGLMAYANRIRLVEWSEMLEDQRVDHPVRLLFGNLIGAGIVAFIVYVSYAYVRIKLAQCVAIPDHSFTAAKEVASLILLYTPWEITALVFASLRRQSRSLIFVGALGAMSAASFAFGLHLFFILLTLSIGSILLLCLLALLRQLPRLTATLSKLRTFILRFVPKS
jgi:hypothetical protein